MLGPLAAGDSWCDISTEEGVGAETEVSKQQFPQLLVPTSVTYSPELILVLTQISMENTTSSFVLLLPHLPHQGPSISDFPHCVSQGGSQ